MNIAFYLHAEPDSNVFEQKILWIKNRYDVISAKQFGEILYSGNQAKNTCMLSIDDGWRSTYDIIFPVLKKHKLPFTIFVSPQVVKSGFNFWTYLIQLCNEEKLKEIVVRRGLFDRTVTRFPIDLIFKELTIDEVYDVLKEYLRQTPDLCIPRGFINEKELIEMHRSGLVEVGAHTLTHPILKNEAETDSKREIVESVSQLSELLDYPVRTFAYPNGLYKIDYTEREMEVAKQAGIKMAFSVNPGVVNANTNPLSIPRWGSIDRLKFGRLGQYLPSRANQPKIRKEIRNLKLK